MGVIFIVYGIRIIYIKRKKEREGKNVTWKTGRVDWKIYIYVLFSDLVSFSEIITDFLSFFKTITVISTSSSCSWFKVVGKNGFEMITLYFNTEFQILSINI